MKKREPFEAHAECDRITAATGAVIRHGGDKAAYLLRQDIIVLPKPEQFDSREAYYGTTFHECGHWSGAPSRLNRNLKGRFGDQDYGF